MWKNYKTIVATVIVLLLIFIATSGYLDKLSHNYTDSAMQRSLISFGVARGLNGIVSVIQGTEIAVHPAGFGINFTPGQVLDPVNDLIEQFSWVMLLSSTSLGIQKLFLTIGSTLIATIVFSVSLLLLLLVIWRPNCVGIQLRKSVVFVALLLVFMRFSVPMATILGQGIYQGFLSSDYQSATKSLEHSRDSFGIINEGVSLDATKDTSLLEDAKHYFQSTKKALDYEKKIDRYKEIAEDVSRSAIKLVVVFVAQSIILPILFLWGIWAGMKLMMRQFTSSVFMSPDRSG